MTLVLSSPPSFLLPQCFWQDCLLSSSALFGYNGYPFLPENDAADELARRGELLAPSAIPCSLFPLISRIHSSLFSDWKRTVSSKLFDTQIPSISTEELVLPRNLRCVLSSTLLRTQPSFRFYHSRIGRIENPSCSACGHLSFHSALSSYGLFAPLTVLFVSHKISDPGAGELSGFWGSMIFRHVSIPRKGSCNNKNR